MKTTAHHSRPPHIALGIVIAISLSLISSGCTSTRVHVPSRGANLPTAVRVGDRVDCTLLDGTQKVFTVTAVEGANLVGESTLVPIAEVSYVAVTRFDGVKTAKSIGLGAATVLYVTLGMGGLLLH
jgi:hypothetical protein